MSSANMKYSNKIKMEADPVKSEVDFSEYMWMGEEGVENFDRQVEKEILEEILKEGHWWLFSAGSQLKSELNADQLPSLPITEEQIANSRLNPNAPEFIPSTGF
ncbi:polyadenylate-binding protein-interacting protein 2 isoform X3 [Octopus bimaculoides]|uniref:polyadenylate-binding protein-interacting protein 2 isoform X3 n=1 Tax=Octopus bimaculoides TaxID=37653 RepID=UPI0022E7C641|nr:polyadenylate-binding protein-interacting protein 2 isoform X3 [Octopus bimaculoides]